MPITYNIPFVLLSICIAFMASYATIHLMQNMFSLSCVRRRVMLMGGALTMGAGIWGMHFVGMLAVELPFSVPYDLQLTMLSWLFAFFFSFGILWLVHRQTINGKIKLISVFIMATGICAMHYTGMYAMRVQPAIEYDIVGVVLTFVIAVGASNLVMMLFKYLDAYHQLDEKNNVPNIIKVKLLSAAVLALAISCMHYTGIAVAHFPEDIAAVGSAGLDDNLMVVLILVGIVVIFLTMMLLSVGYAKIADQDLALVTKFKQLNLNLIDYVNALAKTIIENIKVLVSSQVVNIKLNEAIAKSEESASELLSYKHALDQYAMVSVTDPEGKIIEINDKFIETCQYRREELQGQKHNILSSGKHSEFFFKELWETIKQGKIWRGEICNRAKDDSFFWVDTAIVPHMNDAGEIVRYISVRVDTTQRKKYETELLQARLSADAANRVKSRFLANISHEIRTPMNSIAGMAHLLKKTELNQKQNDYIENILVSTEQLLAMFDAVLDQLKREDQQTKITHERIDLQKILDEVSGKFAATLEKKGIQFYSIIDLNYTHDFIGDETRLGQLLFNLISNAVKFTDEGSITIRAFIQEENEKNCLICFDISDTGIGFDGQLADHLFQPFNQADNSFSRPYDGAGLGLALSKELAELMGGTIGAQSEHGKGSCFWFTVRLLKADQEQTGNARHTDFIGFEGENQFKGFSILVVDDNGINQLIAKEMIESAGAFVKLANNGFDAIDYMHQSHFDCVLMDMQMPGMDGLETTRAIRANKTWANIPVVALTANADETNKKLCLDAGMVDFIVKPVNPSLLYTTLSKWLKPESGKMMTMSKALPGERQLFDSADTQDELLVDASVQAETLGVKTEQVYKFTELFLKSAKKGLAELEEALLANDLQTVALTGHRLKSSALTVGARQFSELCKALEAYKNGGDVEQAKKIVAQMQSMLRSIEKYIEARFQSKKYQ